MANIKENNDRCKYRCSVWIDTNWSHLQGSADTHGVENLEKLENFFQSVKSGKDWKSQNFTQNTGKWGNLASLYFYFFSDILIKVYLLSRFFYLLNSQKITEKILENGKSYWKSQGNLSVWKCGKDYHHSYSWYNVDPDFGSLFTCEQHVWITWVNCSNNYDQHKFPLLVQTHTHKHNLPYSPEV